jgi:hypothetical protein
MFSLKRADSLFFYRALTMEFLGPNGTDFSVATGLMAGMSEPDQNLPPPKYRWPWLALAAVLLGIALAIFWMSLAVRKGEQQRDFTPLPSSAPASQ